MLSKQISRQANGIGSKLADGERALVAYAAPFAIFVALLGLRRLFPSNVETITLVRFILVTATLATVSRRVIPWRPSLLIGSLAVGVAVFFVWIGPDLLWGPSYRNAWLFHNSVTGFAESTLPVSLKANTFFIVVRVLESAVLVPILEELFWRGWLMRWLIHQDFQEIPIGRYTPLSFWAVAVLFASEHGPYWEVGLIAGIAYNWWAVRTRNLADCILAHAVTNAALAAYVLAANQWQYWL